ncbi:MAG: translocation and assembly module TamB [Cellvibrionaceae bacterium]|jgi:translocation and assembly module TamB
MKLNTIRLKALITYSLSGLLALLIICSLVIGWLIATQHGLQWLSKRVLSYLPELSIELIEGKLIGPLTIQNLQYNNQEIAFNLKEAALDWQPSELLLSTVNLNHFTASYINIKRLVETKPKLKEDNTTSPTLKKIIDQLQLPISIIIEKAEIKNLSYDGNYYKRATSESTEPKVKESKIKNETIHSGPFILESFLISAQSDSEKIKINTLEIKSNILLLNGELTLGLASSQNTSGNINWSLLSKMEEKSNLATINGKTQLSGNTKTLKINSSIEPPYSTSLTLSINDLLKKPNTLASVNFKKVNINAINKDWPDYRFNGNIELEGDIDKADLNSKLLVTANNITNNIKEITINTRGNWKNKTLNLNIDANTPSLVESLQVNSVIKPTLLNTQASEAINTTISWRDYNKPNALEKKSIGNSNSDAPIMFSPSGKIKLSGNLKQYQFSLDSLFENASKKQQHGQLIIKGNGTTKEVVLQKIKLSGSIGSLDGKGNIKIQAPIEANITLSGENLNPGILSPQWPGQLTIDMQVKTELKNNQPIINANISSKGTLRSFPFSLTTKGSYTGAITKVNHISIKSGGSSIKASALIDKSSKLFAEWNVDSNKLQELIPGIQGKFISKGKIESLPTVFNDSTLLAPVISASITGSSIVIEHNKIDSIDADIDIDWRSTLAKGKNQIIFNAKKIEAGAIVISSAVLTVKGKPEKHTLNTIIDTDKGDIALALSGALSSLTSKPQWLFTLSDATLTPNNLSAFKLEENIKGKVSASQQEINQHCWSTIVEQKKTASICANGNQTAGVIASNFSITQFPSEYFQPLLPEGLTWTNTVIDGNGKINFVSSKQQLNVAIGLSTSAGELNWINDAPDNTINDDKANNTDEKKNASQSIHLDAGKLSVTSNSKQLDATLTLPVEQQTGIKGTFSIINNQSNFTERPLNGKLELVLNDLSPLVSFIPDASELKGSLNSEWEVGGSLQQPWLDGKLALTDAQVRLNSPGLLLEDISFNLKGSQKNGINYTASVKSAGGTLEAKGNIKLKEQGPEQTLNVKGNDFQVLNTVEAIAYISPELTIDSKRHHTHIEGIIAIPQASITPKKLPESVVTPSEDQIIVDQSDEPATTKQKLSTNIELILGNNVLIDAFGFKGRTTGSLQITKEIQGPTLGNGNIRILDGEYRAFGQGLVIDKGEILFTDGPVGKPGIDIKAVRRPAEGISVGVIARGRAAQPDLTIFSEPAMTQSQQLSWLVLGRPPEQSSDGENNAISQLLLSFTLSKGDSYLNDFRDTFNLDTLNIKTGTGEAGAASDNDLAELVLGKYLSPELYVSYGIGLFKPVNVLSLEYSLGKRWKLKSETSSESSGGDLVYTIER